VDGLKSDESAAAEITTATVRDDASLEADYERCAQITRRSRSSFYYAFILLPPERRRALHAVYAFCRFIDDIADDESIREPALLLKRWREELDRVYTGTPTRALSRVRMAGRPEKRLFMRSMRHAIAASSAVASRLGWIGDGLTTKISKTTPCKVARSSL